MYLSRLTFQTNTVRHQNITKLKCQDVKLDQLSRCQNEKVRVKTATKKWTNAGEKRGEKTILASKYRAAKAGHISAKGNGGQNLLGRKDTTIAQQNILKFLKFLHPPLPTLLLLSSLSPCSCSNPTTGTTLTRGAWWNSALEFMMHSAFDPPILTASLTCLTRQLW